MVFRTGVELQLISDTDMYLDLKKKLSQNMIKLNEIKTY